jgi:hypothetical protein
VEDRAIRELRRYVAPPDEALLAGANGWAEKARRIAARVLTTFFMLLRPLFIFVYYQKNIWRRLRPAARGDRDSIRQLFWYVRLFGLNKY